jgi:hypothetical protein
MHYGPPSPAAPIPMLRPSSAPTSTTRPAPTCFGPWAARMKPGSYRRALELTANPAERAVLRRRNDLGDDAS